VRISEDDLHGPLGAGNPLASALRACRDYIVRLSPGAGQSRDTEPYPLLLVRPDGLHAYDRARQAIEAGDFDLGFELIESDWKVKYPQSDPQLADVEQQALEQARARQQLLAAAAPRAYRNGPMMVANSGERVRWYLMGMGTEVDLHTPHFHGNTVTSMGMRTDVLELLPASMKTADMVPDAPGIWLLHCHVNDHIAAGMSARYKVR